MYISREKAEALYVKGVAIVIISEVDTIEWSMHEDPKIKDMLSHVLANAYSVEELPSLKFKAVAKTVDIKKGVADGMEVSSNMKIIKCHSIASLTDICLALSRADESFTAYTENLSISIGKQIDTSKKVEEPKVKPSSVVDVPEIELTEETIKLLGYYYTDTLGEIRELLGDLILETFSRKEEQVVEYLWRQIKRKCKVGSTRLMKALLLSGFDYMRADITGRKDSNVIIAYACIKNDRLIPT
ncbi:hypothetical protein [Marinomonas phage CPP1m]|uniref:Uncharacterized protein n=1 Tax=Marinomonas phage CPP1m TaxID=1965370 RepID=A0A1W5S6U9_9CAUD|nr:hypothetical protein HOR72_gp03 [Marinomonas phage CPP1m]ARB11222.1 hypothetical protein [Marinomonas phage CPP1m]